MNRTTDEPAQTDTRPVDRSRVEHGLALLDNASAVIAAEVLGDPTWDLTDLELRLALLRVLDAASAQFRWAVPA